MVSHGIKACLLRLLLALCVTMPLRAQVYGAFKEGDLLFCCSDSINAITSVTSGVEDLPIDHVAVVHRIGGEDGLLYVIEAVKPSVQLTLLSDFLYANTTVLLGRVNADVDIRKSIRCCLMMVGKPYDDLYLPGDSAIYCSELVQMNYVTSSGKQLFDAVPMSFHDTSGRVTDYWIDFYASRGMTVPEGSPGSNPGELSRRELVNILAKIDIIGHDIIFHWYR